MAQDIIITPVDGDIVFHNASGTEAGKIYLNGDDLVITNAVGNVLFGDTSSDVYIGDGINSVDIVFEQNGEIRAETGADVTLTIGSSDTTLKLAGLSNQSSEATSLMIDANNVVGYRELGSAAFSATTAFAAASHNHDSRYYTETEVDTLLTGYASTSTATASKNGLMSSTDKGKLDGIASGAEVNVQADWNATSGDAFILNKPSLSFLPLSGGTLTGEIIAPTISDSLYKNGGSSNWFTKKYVRSLGISGGSINNSWVHLTRVNNSTSYGKLILKLTIHGYDDVSSGTEVIDGVYENSNTGQELHRLGWYSTDENANLFREVRSIRSSASGLSNQYDIWAQMAGDWRDTFTVECEYWTYGGSISFQSSNATATTPSAGSDDKSLTSRTWRTQNSNMYLGSNRVLTTADEGTGNGLDADTLDGNDATAFAAASHNHDSRYYTETEVDTLLAGKASTDTATTSKNGLMSSTDKSKLDGIAANANNYVLPTNIITAGTYGSTSNATKIDSITVDSSGRVTAIATGAVGDVQGVTATAPISGGGTGGTVTIGLTTPVSGDWWNGGAAVVGTDGVMEIGKYIDWHDSDTETSDYSYRMTATDTNMAFSGTITATGYNDSNWNTAYNWGNHASAGYLTSLPSHNHDDRYYTETEINTLLGGYASTDTATSSKNGLMSSTDKSKLDGVASNANNYSLPVAGASIGGVKSGTDITVDASGNVSVNNDSHTHDSRYYTETEVSATLGNGIAGWTAGYGSGTYTNISWSVANDAVEIQSSSDTSIGGVFKAIRVKSGDVVRFSVMLKGSAAASNGLYLRLYQYNGDLPDGKTHVSNDAQGSLVQEDSAGDTGWYENGAITTSWTNFERDYTAAADGYVSLVVLNWTGIGNNSVFVKTPDIQKVKMASAGTADSANAVTWDNVSSKPTSFTPSSHNHDDRYYTETEVDTLLGGYASTDTATTSKNGLMSSTDKSKLDGVAANANNYSLPSAISLTSAVFGDGVTLSESTDRADLLLVKSSTSSWGGLQISNTSNEILFSMMGDGTIMGFYDDQNSDWVLQRDENGSIRLYANASNTVTVTTSGLTVDGRVLSQQPDTGIIFQSGNSSATGTPEQLRVSHNYGDVDIRNLRGGISINSVVSLKTDSWHTSTDAKNRLYFGNNARTYFGSANGYEWRSSSDGALAVLLNTGELGIGTTSPAYSIDVSGGAIAIRGNAAGNSLRFNDTGGTSRNAVYVDTSNYLNVGNANYTGLKLYHATTTAPQTNSLDGGGISQGFGNTDNGTVLAEPSAWLEVRVGTTDYVIPMYLNG